MNRAASSLLMLALLTSCKESPQYPDRPYIGIVDESGDQEIALSRFSAPYDEGEQEDLKTTVHVVVGEIIKLRRLRFTLAFDPDLEITRWDHAQPETGGPPLWLVRKPPEQTSTTLRVDLELRQPVTVKKPMPVLQLELRARRPGRHFLDVNTSDRYDGAFNTSGVRVTMTTLPALMPSW